MLTQFFCTSSYFSYTENYWYCNGRFFNLCAKRAKESMLQKPWLVIVWMVMKNPAAETAGYLSVRQDIYQ